jgi:hypothetical protein
MTRGGHSVLSLEGMVDEWNGTIRGPPQTKSSLVAVVGWTSPRHRRLCLGGVYLVL